MTEMVCEMHNQPKPHPLDSQSKIKRADELFVELGLHENPKLRQNSDTWHHLWEALYQYGGVFSTFNANIGATSDVEFEIKLKQGAQPVKQQARLLHPRMMADLESQIDKWLQADIMTLDMTLLPYGRLQMPQNTF